MTELEYTADEILHDPETVLVDVRPRDERFGDLGYIPGSRSVPEDELLAGPALLENRWDPNRHIVLYCLSGRRSGELVAQVEAMGFENVSHLKGGILEWRASGHPVCGVNTEHENVPKASDAEEVKKAIVSCFVAETVENTLSGAVPDDGFNPKDAVDQLYHQAERMHPNDQWVHLNEFLDLIAEVAWHRGHPRDRIAVNTDTMRAMIFKGVPHP